MEFIRNSSPSLEIQWRGAFLCFDFDCKSGFELHGEVVGKDGDLFDEFFYQSFVEGTVKSYAQIRLQALAE